MNHITQKNEEFLVDLKKSEKEEIEKEEMRKLGVAKAELNELTKNLHHLCSTTTIPGVYNPPYIADKPKAFGQEVETHLRTSFKVYIS